MRQGNRTLGAVLIIIGLLLAAFPLAKWGVSFYYQYRALAAWEDQMPALEPVEAVEPIDTQNEPVEEPEEEKPKELPQEDGLLQIPKIKLSAVVVQGVTEEHLKLGPGFYPQSAHPEVGNVSIAAHRGTYGSWFRNLDKLAAGDVITLMIGDKVYHYSVRESFVTHNRDWSVVESIGISELTLTTCLWTTTTQRLILKADLVGESQVLRGD